MADGLHDTCYEMTKANLQKQMLIVILPDSSPPSQQADVVINGSNLYCEIFDKPCIEPAMQLFARSFKDHADYPVCTPFCGQEAMCSLVSGSSTGDRCEFKCMCPPNGCNELILAMHAGAVRDGKKDAEICEITRH